MDFSGVLLAVNSDAVVLAITALAAIKILPNVAKWAYGTLIGWFKGEETFQEWQDRTNSEWGRSDLSQTRAEYFEDALQKRQGR